MDNYFGIADYIVFSCVLLFSASVGLYYRLTGGRQRTTKEYLLADKNMSIIPVGFSLMASFMSAVTLLGVPAENYVYGTQFVVINFSYIFGTIISAFLYLPVFFKLQATSAYHYLQLRFGKITSLLASGSFIIQMTLYMSIVLYAPALALNAVTGVPKWVSILSVGFVCTFYSTIGGMKAVLWTDLFQSILMFAAIFAVIFKGLEDSSFENIWEIANRGKRIEFFNFNSDVTVRHTFWTQVIGGIFTYTSLYGVNQAQIQRLLTVKNLQKSQFALFLNWPILTALSLTASFSGLVVYSKYYNCDPIKSKRVVSSDQLLPLFVMDFLSHVPGLAGLFVSGIFSGALSTVSSAVNSLAAVTVEDFIKPCLKEHIKTDRKINLISKGLALAFGLICILLVYLVEQLGGILQASLTIFGIVGGPLLGLFSLGMFCPRCNEKGAIVGYLAGLIISFWIGFGAMIHKPDLPILSQSTEGCSFGEYSNITDYTNITVLPLDGNLFLINSTFTDMNSSTISMNATVQKNITDLVDPSDKNSKRVLYPYRISYMWYAPIGFICVLVIGIIVSYFTERPLNLNSDLLSPPVAYYYNRFSSAAVDGKYFATLETIPENGVIASIPDTTQLDNEQCNTKL